MAQALRQEITEHSGTLRVRLRHVATRDTTQKFRRNPSSTCRGAAPFARPVDRPNVAERRLPTGTPRFTKFVMLNASAKSSTFVRGRTRCFDSRTSSEKKFGPRL